ncbi:MULTISPECIES: PTS sugar transporter subunit IIC [Pseudolactococcus]|uniref:Permease IIC component n=1 Tax=Pseudolactococcus piscium MKFS47 TaxID=297352 RepID=A0A0D6DV22_9LACT|nr:MULTISPECIES: PTS transporter subunit EIIC [Lactococcus]MCJ1970700.1 PTS sugar transporter subunit IIC [Lactococcus carnosus]CEN27345.1 Cellobiose-specific PTS system IIC component [Lactococcus piscium MKFS47]
MGKVDKFTNKALIISEKVGNNVYLKAISNGLMATLPINIIGSLALLLAVLPVKPWTDFIGKIGLTATLLNTYSLTVGVISIYASFLIGYQLASNLKQNSMSAGIVSLLSFLILTPMVTLDKITTLNNSKLGAAGLFTAMIASLLFSRIFCYFNAKSVGIKMPDSVPPFVRNVFANLVPLIISASSAIFLSYLFTLTSYGSFSDFVYSIIATPLNGLSSNVGSLLLIVFFQMILWFFGIHGSNIVSGFIVALYLPMDVANLDALKAGTSNGHLPNILGQGFYNLFAGIGGAGGTLSLIIVILLFSKSKETRVIGKLSAIPGLFTINEPVIFGLPLVLNPIMAIPFILTPLVQVLTAYLAIASGIFPRLSGFQAPFGTPIAINGFLSGGWKIAVLQIICIFIGCLIYYPFIKLLDRKNKSEEVVTVAEV